MRPTAARPTAARRRRRALAGLLAVGASLGVGLALVLSGGDQDPESPAGTGAEVAEAAVVGSPIPLDGKPVGIAVDEDRSAVLVAAREGQRLVELGRDGSERGATPLGANAENVVVESGFAWVTLSGGSEVAAVPLDGGEPARAVVGDGPRGILAEDGVLFVAGWGDREGRVVRLPAEPGAEVAQASAEGAAGERPYGLLVDRGRLWVTARESGELRELEPESLEPRGDPIEVGDGPKGIALAGDRIWVANTESGTVSVIDPSSGQVEQEVDVGGLPRGIAVGFGSVWVANGGGYVSRIDPAGREEAQRIRGLDPGASPEELATGLGHVWVTTGEGDSVVRIDPGG